MATRPSVRKKYEHSVDLNRVHYKSMIPLLFSGHCDEAHRGKVSVYTGQIAGVEVEVDFSAGKPCRLYTRHEKDLARVLKEALDNLSTRECAH